MVIEKYKLENERDKTMFVFDRNGKYFGHVVKDRTDKTPAKLIFETGTYVSVDALKQDYPELKVE